MARARTSAAQEGLFERVYDQMLGEHEPPAEPLKNKAVKLTVRLFHPIGESVAEMPAYKREWRFKGPAADTYIDMLKRMQRKVGATILVFENDVLRAHHTLEKTGWNTIEERT